MDNSLPDILLQVFVILLFVLYFIVTMLFAVLLLSVSFLCGMRWAGRFPSRSHHAPLQRWDHLPKVPAQHLRPLPLPRLPAPEASPHWRRGEHRRSATAETHSRDWNWGYNWDWNWDRVGQRSFVNTNPIPGRGKRHQQQGKKEEKPERKTEGRWTGQLPGRDGKKRRVRLMRNQE